MAAELLNARAGPPAGSGDPRLGRGNRGDTDMGRDRSDAVNKASGEEREGRRRDVVGPDRCLVGMVGLDNYEHPGDAGTHGGPGNHSDIVDNRASRPMLGGAHADRHGARNQKERGPGQGGSLDKRRDNRRERGGNTRDTPPYPALHGDKHGHGNTRGPLRGLGGRDPPRHKNNPVPDPRRGGLGQSGRRNRRAQQDIRGNYNGERIPLPKDRRQEKYPGRKNAHTQQPSCRIRNGRGELDRLSPMGRA